MKKIAVVYMLLLPHVLFAQNETNIWYFGNRAGIDFNSGSAVAISDSKMATHEGCASICDNFGQLLFYTNGQEIRNSNHDEMPNGLGLLGHTSSTQSAIIIKRPGSDSLYYVFTTAASGGNETEGLKYSVVDMSLDNGLGDVNQQKNVSVVKNTGERLTAIRHRNGTDFWIITQILQTNTLHAYLLSSSGLNHTAVTSNVGKVKGYSEYQGYLKGSPDGRLLALACTRSDYVELYHFSNSSGRAIFSGIYKDYSGNGPYGLEFSPNGKLLYVSSQGTLPKIYQFNLQLGSQEQIEGSKKEIGEGSHFGGALQLAPDGKIYHADGKKLGVIDHPDKLGIACGYRVDGFTLNRSPRGIGLPNFLNYIKTAPFFTFTQLCYGDSTRFSINSFSSTDSVRWYFGDPNSGIKNTSVDLAPFHLFSSPGTFTVALTLYEDGNSKTIFAELRIKSSPTFSLGADTTICEGDTIELNATTHNATYLWKNNATTPTVNVDQEGSYWAAVTVNNCTATDTIGVSFDSLLNFNLGRDTVVCKREFITLNATTTNATYLWQDSTKSPTLNVNTKGSYWVEVSVNNCSKTDTITVEFEECDCHLQMANAFTPNMDALNDGFSPVFDCYLTDYRLVIFNRWGEEIFETNDPNEAWDGSFKGRTSPDGVYLYLLAYRFKDRNMPTKHESGKFTLIK